MLLEFRVAMNRQLLWRCSQDLLKWVFIGTWFWSPGIDFGPISVGFVLGKVALGKVSFARSPDFPKYNNTKVVLDILHALHTHP